MAVAHEFHTHDQFEKSLNATFIALIPKKSEAFGSERFPAHQLSGQRI